MDNLIGMVRRTFYSLIKEELVTHGQIEKLTPQPKEFVNQIIDTNEWERREILLIIFNTPVMPVDTIKIN